MPTVSDAVTGVTHSSQQDLTHLARDIRNALLTGVMAGNIFAPIEHKVLLQLTLKAAVQITKAEYGTLFLLDEKTNELVFEASIGGAAKDLKKFRMPADQGIAGHVAQTRKPLIVNDVETNEKWSFKVGVQVMFAPRTILCVPLLMRDRLIGVLEVCDKVGNEIFTESDSNLLTLFTNHACISVGLSQSHQSTVALVLELIESCANLPKDQKEKLHQQILQLDGGFREDAKFRERLEMVQWIQANSLRSKKLNFFQNFVRSRKIAKRIMDS